MIAALFVDGRGGYMAEPGVDPWPEARDARLYAGPWPVVAHPPCTRWCRFAGFVEARWGYKRGEDGGCFASALASLHRCPSEIDTLTVTPELDGSYHVGIVRKFLGRRVKPYPFFGRKFSASDIELALGYLGANGFR